MASPARVRLLEIDPDLFGPLDSEELAEARQVTVPVITIGPDGGQLTQLQPAGAFAALVIEGMLLRQLRVADQLGMRLHGPGDIVPMKDSLLPMVAVESSLKALPGTRLAVLGPEALLAVRRWPSLLAALHLRTAQQVERVTAQLVICQLPRVEQRLLSLLWLLAESWGRVTPAGTTVPLKLTHEALGALIGARRPTVTLALRDLAERGAIVRQEEGWLLLEPPPEGTQAPERPPVPQVLEDLPNGWTLSADADALHLNAARMSDAHAALSETIAALREQHTKDRERFDERIKTLAGERERSRSLRRRITRDRVRRQTRRSPSS